jgi:hypothetical protein
MVRKYTGRRGGDIVCKEDEEMNEDGTLCVPKKDESETSSDEEGKGMGGRRHRRRRTLRVPKGVHVKAKTLKRMLKSKGLKTTGKKSTLRSRARKAHLIGGSA